MGKSKGTFCKWVKKIDLASLHVFNISMKLKLSKMSPSDIRLQCKLQKLTGTQLKFDIIRVTEGKPVFTR